MTPDSDRWTRLSQVAEKCLLAEIVKSTWAGNYTCQRKGYSCVPQRQKTHVHEKVAEVLCIEKVVPCFRHRGPLWWGVGCTFCPCIKRWSSGEIEGKEAQQTTPMRTDKKSRRKQPGGLLSRWQQINPNSCPGEIKGDLYTFLCFLSNWQQQHDQTRFLLRLLHFHQHSSTEMGEVCSEKMGASFLFFSIIPQGGERWGIAKRWTLQMKCWCTAVSMQKKSAPS